MSLTTKDALLERMVAATEGLLTSIPGKFLKLIGGTITGDLEVNGSLTNGGKNVEAVNDSGTGYIRYESGVQICWGTITTNSDGTFSSENFPVSFSSAPSVSCTCPSATSSASNAISIQAVSYVGSISAKVSIGGSWNTVSLFYIAIGNWK